MSQELYLTLMTRPGDTSELKGHGLPNRVGGCIRRSVRGWQVTLYRRAVIYIDSARYVLLVQMPREAPLCIHATHACSSRTSALSVSLKAGAHLSSALLQSQLREATSALRHPDQLLKVGARLLRDCEVNFEFNNPTATRSSWSPSGAKDRLHSNYQDCITTSCR